MDRNFAQITHEVMAAYGYSEAALAKRLGVSQPTIHRIKTGQVETPNYTIGAALVALYESRPRSLGAA